MSVHIKSLRRARGLTQQGLASLIGVGQARVAAIEKNPGAVSLDQLLQIVHALDAKLQLVDTREVVSTKSTRFPLYPPSKPPGVAEATPIPW